MSRDKQNICVVGGAGHAGLPLSIAFASAGQDVIIYDLNTTAMDDIRKGTMPFVEYGAEPLLKQALQENRLTFTSDPTWPCSAAIRYHLTVSTSSCGTPRPAA